MNKRSFVITRTDSGKQLAAVLRDHFRLDWSAARQMVKNQQVLVDGKVVKKHSISLRKGQTLEITGEMPAAKPAHKPRFKSATLSVDETIAKPIIRYTDRHILIVDKPAGLTTVRHREETKEHGERARRYLPPTLADLLPSMLAKGKAEKLSRVRAVHRLDRDTSGLVVFARTPEAESKLGKQMRSTKVERKYLALVRGQAKTEKIESFLVDDRGDGRRGSSNNPGEGKRAVTHVKVVEELGDFTLVECRLETGRTHQVRIHLGERGTPLCGDRVYDRPLHGKPVFDRSGAPRIMLHASFLGLDHPDSGKHMFWASKLPEDMETVVGRLRK